MTEFPSQPGDKRTRRVLILDDERIVADTTALVLRQNGYDAHPTYSAKSAVVAAAVWQPHLLIADILLHDSPIGGIEAALRICTILPNCRILLISGQLITGDLLERYRSEGYDFTVLAKPVDPNVLFEHVAGALSGAKQRCQIVRPAGPDGLTRPPSLEQA